MPLLDLQDVDDFLARSEAQVPNLRPDCAKRVVWAQASGVRTPKVLLYIHGFSATGQELRPLPDLVAKALGANIFFTRLTGHGRDGPAMAEATFEAWQKDVSEAFELARAIGDEVIVMGCSTGCTLATYALAQGQPAKAVIHVSPNFGLRSPFVQVLVDLPGARHWGPFVAGQTRSFEPINDMHAAYWTTTYPTAAIFPMADAVRAVRAADLSTIVTPALFAHNLTDKIVSSFATRKAMARWGAMTEELLLVPTPEDDEEGHVMAGDVFSPGQTGPLSARILAWLQAL